jgi:hypothetical protein
LRVTIEHFGWISPDENPDNKSMSWNEREDDYSSVAYWYQAGRPTFAARAPTAALRKLPSIERVTAYATDLATHGSGSASSQSLDVFDHPQLLYTPKSEENAWLEVPIEVARKEPLRLLLNMATSYDFGIYQPYLDGVRLGEPIDLYSAEVAQNEFHLLDFWPEPGKHILRLECVGKNSASKGYYLGIESVRLRERRPRVEQLGFDKNKDWRKAPVLYN